MKGKESRKVIPRERWLKRRCVFCDRVFPTSRTDAQLCSPRCRKGYQRKCDKIVAQAVAQTAAQVPTTGRKGGAK